ncbi:MAG: fumarate hydratase class II, partial [Rheinheimera aquimaris]
RLLSNSCSALATQAIAGFTVREDNISKALALNPILVTALNPLIGYAKAAEIAKQAYKERRPVIDVAQEHTSYSRSELEQLLDPARLCQGGNIS